MTYLQSFNVCDASFIAEDSRYSLKVHTHSCKYQGEESIYCTAQGNVFINTLHNVLSH